METSSSLKMIELYSGAGTISKAFRERGFLTTEVDIRKRVGKCVPDLRADIGLLKVSDLPLKNYNVVWCSFPCQVFSYVAGNYHFFDGKPVSDAAKKYLALLQHTLKLIREINPQYYFIENPRGRLRYEKIMLDWLTKNDGMTKELTYSSYGHDTKKPTNIFTNAHDWQPLQIDSYGRGAKNPSNKPLSNKTLHSKQQIPVQLANDIASYCLHKEWEMS